MILLNKPAGITPLQAIEKLRKQKPEYKEEILSYAGRLDPMAEGLLIILQGEENNQRQKFIDLPKTYNFQILLGISTDTYDVMGLFTTTAQTEITEDIIDRLNTEMRTLIGTHNFSYPPYSSKTVNGKPLYWYTQNGLLDTIIIPKKEITVLDLQRIAIDNISNQILYESIKNRIQNVSGNFRQKDILNQWEIFFTHIPTPSLPVLNYIATVTSGTYIRGLVHELEKKITLPMITFTIKRTHVGEYNLDNAVNLI